MCKNTLNFKRFTRGILKFQITKIYGYRFTVIFYYDLYYNTNQILVGIKNIIYGKEPL